jgi:uncharacterized membrane protein YfcA
MNAKDVLLIALAIVATLYALAFVRGLRRVSDPDRLTTAKVATGFATNFFDTLGIGSFAPAFIFTRIVPVDARTLILMIGASMAGAWLGAGVVASWSRRKVQIGMGCALIAAAALMLTGQLGLTPTGGQALGLTGALLVVAVAVNFVLGALMTLGIGLYAPCMILISLLGMDPKSAFPIMMGSCAFLMPVASVRFIRSGKFSPGACLGLLIGGVPAVLIAAFIVKSLPIGAVRWLVVVVVLYTATALLRAARRESLSAAGPGDPSASR